MRDSLRLGRIAGFPVAVHWSVLVVVLLLAGGLADGVLPEAAPGHSTATYWLVGVVGALLLLCSLLAHEVSHAIVARRAGVEVDGLTLWMFGGIANLRGEAPTARADLRIAAVGPATSLVLAAAFGGIWWALDTSGQSALVVSVVGWLATINVVLAVFNLVPGAPLDGGRVLRALLWSRWGDRERAAAAATTAGQGVGYVLVALGLLSLLAGDYVGGLWLMLIGWFLHGAARAEQAAYVAEHVLRGVAVGDVMSSEVRTVGSELTVEELVESLVLGGRHSAYPVVGPDGTVRGLVTLGQLRLVPAPARSTTLVGDVAVPLARLATCTPDEPVAAVLPRLASDAGRRALVFEQGRLVGILTPTDITRVLEAKQLLGGAAMTSPARVLARWAAALLVVGAVLLPSLTTPAAAWSLRDPFTRETVRPGAVDVDPYRIAHVDEVQWRLKRLGLFSATPNGHFGPITTTAVKRFQKRNGLAVTGVVGPATWRLLIRQSVRGRSAVPSSCRSAGWHACYDRSWHQVNLYRDGRLLNSWLVRGGASSTPTYTGTYRVYWRDVDHVSTTFDDAPMPFSQFFHGGQALHGSRLMMDPYVGHSHGCVNFWTEDAQQLWNLTSTRTLWVHVYGAWS